MVRFALTTLRGPVSDNATALFLFQGKDVNEIREEDRTFALTAEDLVLLNPNTRTCPIFRTRRDAEITKGIYRRVPVLIREGPPEENPWGISFLRMFDMTSDSHLFRTRADLEAHGWQLEGNVFVRGGERYLPLYEAKMISLFNHRFGDFSDGPEGQRAHILPEVPESRLGDPNYQPLPFYWVPSTEVNAQLGAYPHRWLVGFRGITDSRASARSVIIGVFPRAGVGNSLPILHIPGHTSSLVACLTAVLSGFVLDYVARSKIAGLNLNFFIMKQLPVLPAEALMRPCPWDAACSTVVDWLLPRILELTYTSWDLVSFARDCGYEGPPFAWNEERRFRLRCELDAAFFHLYGIGPEDVEYIMETFPIVKRRDEEQFGEYRTKTHILAMYEALAAGAKTQTECPGEL